MIGAGCFAGSLAGLAEFLDALFEALHHPIKQLALVAHALFCQRFLEPVQRDRFAGLDPAIDQAHHLRIAAAQVTARYGQGLAVHFQLMIAQESADFGQLALTD